MSNPEKEIYHVFNKSIAGYRIFNSPEEFDRMMLTLRYYCHTDLPTALSQLVLRASDQYISKVFDNHEDKCVKIISYCLMPTHIHFILTPVTGDGISKFMKNVQNSYSRYFNERHNRRGPLWEGRFKKQLIETDEQLLHVTRYLHLNPTTALLVDAPDDWQYSSYVEYLGKNKDTICDIEPYIDLKAIDYQGFVEDQQDYQQKLAMIKNCIQE